MKALIVEDDKYLQEIISDCLKDTFNIETSDDGEDGLYLAEQDIYDVIILDIMMPNMNGYEVLKNLRNQGIQTPVLFLTAKDSIDDKIHGLKLGADDYLVKPFHSEELILRVKALTRRTGIGLNEDILKFKNLELNIKTRTAKIHDETIVLQGKQFDILEYLVNNVGNILTKEQIFDRIWGFDSETTTNVVEVYASNLRKILKIYQYDKYIKTIRGLGYMLSDDGN